MMDTKEIRRKLGAGYYEDKDLVIAVLCDEIDLLSAVADIGKRIISINDDSIAVLKGEKKVSNKEAYIDSCAHEIGVQEIKLRKALSNLTPKKSEP